MQKLKSFLADDALYMVVVIVLVGGISFGLGRSSVLGKAGEGLGPTGPAGVILTEPEITAENKVDIDTVTATGVVGSRSGTKYHLPDCPGALQMKDENKIFFSSIEAAQAAGYTPAGNCPGLE